MGELRQYGITTSDLDDNGLNVASKIKLLIGSDVTKKLMIGRQMIIFNGLVTIEILLGWRTLEKIPGDMNHERVARTVISLLLENSKIEDLWNLDVLYITDTSKKKITMELLKATHHHLFAQLRFKMIALSALCFGQKITFFVLSILNWV